MIATLRSAVRRERRKWQASNPHGRKFQRAWPERALVWAGRHPIRTTLFLLVVYATALGASTYWVPPYSGLVDLGPSEHTEFNAGEALGSVLATQAAVVGLVYAIVFAFTTIFLGKQTATKASVQSYLVTSGAKFVGVSSLALVGALSATLVLEPAVEIWTAFAWLATALVWLLINILLTVYFLTRTFQFATPEGRRRARDDYAVCIAWPHEWERHAASVIATMPNKFGLFTGDDYRDSPTGEKPAFSFIGYELQRISDGVKCGFIGRRQVSNVYYWPLQLAYNSWQARAISTAGVGRASSALRAGPLFIVRAHPEPIVHEAGNYLAGTTGEPNLNVVERALCRIAVRFQAAGRYDNEITVVDCLSEAQADCRAAMDAGSDEDFRVQFLALLELFDDLFEASAYVDSEGRIDNHALTSSNAAVWGNAVAHDWCRILEDLLTATLLLVPRTPDFAMYVVRAPKRLATRTRDVLNDRLKELFIDLQAKFLRLVLDWGGAEHSAHRALTREHDATFPEPVASRYVRLLSEGVGGWESLKNEGLLPLGDEGRVEWSSWPARLTLMSQHLRWTLGLLAYCVYKSEQISISRMLGSAMRWRGQLDFLLDDHDSYIENAWQLTVETAKLDWQEVKEGKLRGHGADESMQLTAMAHALSNLWKDGCTLLVATLSQVADSLPAEARKNAAVVIRAMLVDRSLGLDDGSSDLDQPLQSPQGYVEGFIRIQVLDGGYRVGYQALMDGVAKMCAPNDWEGRVSGRLFSLRGPDSVEDVMEGIAFSLTVLARRGWMVEDVALHAAFDEWKQHDERRRSLRNDLENLAHALEGLPERFAKLWALVVADENIDLAEARDHALRGVRSVLALLDAARHAALADAVVDPERCESLAENISSALPDTDKYFPLQGLPLLLLKDRSPTTTPKLMKVLGYPKGRLTNPPMAGGSSNEVEVLRHQLFGRLRLNVVGELIKRLNPEERVAGGRAALLAAVSEYVEVLGEERQAVLLVPSLNEPEWFGELRKYAVEILSGRAPEERLVREAGHGKDRNYVGHLRGAATYVGLIPAGQFVLLPWDALGRLELLQQGAGYVEVAAIPSEEDAALCTLTLKVEMDVVVGNGPAWRIRYRSSREGGGQNQPAAEDSQR